MSVIDQNRYLSFLVSLVLATLLGFLFLLSGIWYLIIFGGLIAALAIRKGSLIAFLSAFLGGLLVSMIYILTLPLSAETAVMNEVASLAGISAFLLWTLIFLVSALLSSAGALIGTAFSPLFHVRTTEQAE